MKKVYDSKIAADAESSGRHAAHNAIDYNDFEFEWRELDQLKISEETSVSRAAEIIQAAILSGKFKLGNGHDLRNFLEWWLAEDAEEGSGPAYLVGVLAGGRAKVLMSAFAKGYAAVVAAEAVREAKARAEEAERERRLDEED